MSDIVGDEQGIEDSTYGTCEESQMAKEIKQKKSPQSTLLAERCAIRNIEKKPYICTSEGYLRVTRYESPLNPIKENSPPPANNPQKQRAPFASPPSAL